RFYEALRKQGISASLLIYPTGGHGFSFARHKSGSVTRWSEDCKAWLAEAGWLK
ncbi:MAG: alpha/beta hydrolase, partial [Bacteroidetes bacterium]